MLRRLIPAIYFPIHREELWETSKDIVEHTGANNIKLRVGVVSTIKAYILDIDGAGLVTPLI